MITANWYRLQFACLLRQIFNPADGCYSGNSTPYESLFCQRLSLNERDETAAKLCCVRHKVCHLKMWNLIKHKEWEWICQKQSQSCHDSYNLWLTMMWLYFKLSMKWQFLKTFLYWSWKYAIIFEQQLKSGGERMRKIKIIKINQGYRALKNV